MKPAQCILVSIVLVITGFALSPLGSAIQPVSAVSHHSPASHSRTTLKRTWHSGPASTPPETEIIPSPPPLPSPAESPDLGSEEEHNVPAAADPQRGTPAASGLEAPSATVPNQPDDTPAAVPERVRVRDELKRLRTDADARRAFYDDLRGTVERVRTGGSSKESDR
jgi:hypothetical protein